jgi:hypothetical protein
MVNSECGFATLWVADDRPTTISNRRFLEICLRHFLAIGCCGTKAQTWTVVTFIVCNPVTFKGTIRNLHSRGAHAKPSVK